MNLKCNKIGKGKVIGLRGKKEHGGKYEERKKNVRKIGETLSGRKSKMKKNQ